MLERSKTSLDVSVQICPYSGFGTWVFVFKSTQNILICQTRIVSAGASYICTSAVTLKFIHYQMTHFFHVFFRHCYWWTTAEVVVLNVLSTSFEELNPNFDTPIAYREDNILPVLPTSPYG